MIYTRIHASRRTLQMIIARGTLPGIVYYSYSLGLTLGYGIGLR